MDTRFNHNKTELGVLVLAGALQVLADVDSLLNQKEKIFWNLRGQAVLLQEAENLGSSYGLDLSNSRGITKNNTNLK